MRKTILSLVSLVSPFCTLTAYTATSTLESTPNGEELLSQFDQYRGFADKGFSFIVENQSHNNSDSIKENRLKVKVLSERSVVSFLTPERDKGRAMLKEGKNMWLYIPGTRKVIRIAPAQRLIGETSNGDVVGTTFSSGYTVETVEKVDVHSQPAWRLNLTASKEGETYRKIALWLSRETGNKPIKSEFYSRSGKLLKTAIYESFIEVNGALKIKSMKLVDALRENKFTTMVFSQYQLEDLDSAMFNKDALRYLDF